MKGNIKKGIKDKKLIATIDEEFVGSQNLREALVRLLTNKRESHRKAGVAKEEYGEACWPYKQADHIGYSRAIDEVIGLLTSP